MSRLIIIFLLSSILLGVKVVMEEKKNQAALLHDKMLIYRRKICIFVQVILYCHVQWRNIGVQVRKEDIRCRLYRNFVLVLTGIKKV